MSTGMEVLVQENAKTDITGERKNDLDKLEYCTKILLTNAYLALPTTARQDVHKFETYTIQTNELTLSLSAASYLFENTVCMFGLTDISIPRTVEAFQNASRLYIKCCLGRHVLVEIQKHFMDYLKRQLPNFPKGSSSLQKNFQLKIVHNNNT
ncbi:hypothetical protein RhiirA4_410315 [Rhizophagus irregularis]|uniref:Uncharacterized protein n=1 Tax=Rhizophagus irregularis TaxID=588596 RepID=A0A2I1H8C2_9GLOM|nr:hypothetical protein RhiirA4_410315 [Rhizophagus irregularis]